MTGPAAGCDSEPGITETVTCLFRGGTPSTPCMGLLPLPVPGAFCPCVLLQLLVDKARRGLPGSHLGLQGPRRWAGPAVPPGCGGVALPASSCGPWTPWLDAWWLLLENRAFLQGTCAQAFLVGGGAGTCVPGMGVLVLSCEEGSQGCCGERAVFPTPLPSPRCRCGSPSSRLLVLPGGGGQTGPGPESPSSGPPLATHVPFLALASGCGAARGVLCPRARGSRCPRRWGLRGPASSLSVRQPSEVSVLSRAESTSSM